MKECIQENDGRSPVRRTTIFVQGSHVVTQIFQVKTQIFQVVPQIFIFLNQNY
jgi:hypothetical protein